MNPRIWYAIAAVGCLVNVAGVAFAARPGEPWHATVHAALAVAFGLWAQHLRARLRRGAADAAPATGSSALRDAEAEATALRDEVDVLRRELGEVQERMDFAERLLSQARDRERVAARPPPPPSP